MQTVSPESPLPVGFLVCGVFSKAWEINRTVQSQNHLINWP